MIKKFLYISIRPTHPKYLFGTEAILAKKNINFHLVIYIFKVKAFKGTKSVIISTTSLLGGKNPFLVNRKDVEKPLKSKVLTRKKSILLKVITYYTSQKGI